MTSNDKLKIISYYYQKFSILSIRNALKKKYSETEIVRVIAESEITIDEENFIVPSIMNYSFYINRTSLKQT